MAQHKTNECRKLTRFIIQVRALDSETKSFFAYTENLHTVGMMVSSEKKIPLGKEFHLELAHIRDNGEMITLPLHARCVWNRYDTLNLYTARFDFIDLKPQQARDIEILIEELALD